MLRPNETNFLKRLCPKWNMHPFTRIPMKAFLKAFLAAISKSIITWIGLRVNPIFRASFIRVSSSLTKSLVHQTHQIIHKDRKSDTKIQDSCLFHEIQHFNSVLKKIEGYIVTDNQIQRINSELKRMIGHSKSPNRFFNFL